MDKQYSVEFFVSFIDAIQKLCRDYLHFEQGVELSGYLALEIDNIKKERYVLSEFVQKTGQVISESYCTKAFKTVKKLPERNTDSENMMPARVTNSKWSQRNVHIGDVTPSRYRKPTSLPPMPSSPLLHNRTHTITSSSLEEFTEAERQREQNQQPLLNKWPIQTGTASRASKRNNALDPLSDSPSHKKEKVDPSSVVNVSRQTSSEQHDVVANLTDTISMPMSDTVVIKDEDDTLVDNGDTFLRATTGESSATHSTDKPGGHDQQSLNNFPISPHTVHDETGAGITSADEAIMDMHFKMKTSANRGSRPSWDVQADMESSYMVHFDRGKVSDGWSSCMTYEQRLAYNEKTKLRMRKYRERKRQREREQFVQDVKEYPYDVDQNDNQS